MSEPVSCIEPYVLRLERRVPFSAAARDALTGLPSRTRDFPSYRDIVREGDLPVEASFIKKGLVSRYKTLRNGSRQIVSFHIPRDMVDLQSTLVVVADHGIRTHTSTTIVSIPHGPLIEAAARFPEIARAFWFDTLIDAAVFREWTLNVGRRNARERTAHLLLEFAYRFENACISVEGGFELPLTQTDMSDALAITPVHLNRTLQSLRADRLIRTHARKVWIENEPAMIDLAGFDASYLHPEGPRSPPVPAST